MLPIKPLEFVDFSGGMTENVLQGDPRRYEFADNFWLTTDKKLRQRDGIIPYENQIDVSNKVRINSLNNFLSDSVLIAQMGRRLYYSDEINDTMTEIQGRNSNPAIQGGNEYSQLSFGEFNKTKIYITTDGGDNDRGILPSKIFKDENDDWVALTVGLPRAWTRTGETEDSLLAKCIDLANALRESFIEHMEDVYSATYAVPPLQYEQTFRLHYSKDKYALSYLESQTVTTSEPALPSPLPTPAPAATDEASLYTLCRALSLAYTAHIDDAKIGSTLNPTDVTDDDERPLYHWYAAVWDGTRNGGSNAYLTLPSGPHARLTDTGTPETVEEAAAQLDDIYQKWYFHRNGIWVHSNKNDPTLLDLHSPSIGKIGTYKFGDTYPDITPDFSDLYNYANNLRYLWHVHIGVTRPTGAGVSGHSRDNSPNTISSAVDTYDYNLNLECHLDECATEDSFYLMTYWLRSLYHAHRVDATVADHVAVTFECTSGSADITSVVRVDTGAAYQMPLGGWLYVSQTGTGDTAFSAYSGEILRSANFPFTFRKVGQIVASGSGTATIDKPFTYSDTGVTGQASNSFYHLAAATEDGTTYTDGTTVASGEPSTTALGTEAGEVGTTMATWITLLNDFFTAFQAHAVNSDVHSTSVKNTGRWNLAIESVPYPNFIQHTVSTVSYAFIFKHAYTVGSGGVEYETISNPIFSDSINVAVSYPVNYYPPDQVNYTLKDSWPVTYKNTQYPITETRTNTITNLPVITNTYNTNYATDAIKLEIYRTLNGGTTFFKVGEVDNGTTTFVDSVNDTIPTPGEPALDDSVQLYTTGGVIGYDQPPQCKFIHIFGGTAYYGAVTDADQYLPNRVVQSVQRAPDAAPLTFYDDLDDALTGLTSTRSNVIAMCEASVFRLEGGFNELGQGQITHERISEEIGCLNSAGIVKTEIGVFFAGTDGFYYTDGYQIIKVSLELDELYASLTSNENQKRNIYGSYDRLNRRVYWTMREGPDSSFNSIAYILYLDYGVKPSGVFTRMKNGINFRPASMAFGRKFGKKVAFIGDERGFLLRTDPWTKTDTVVSASLAVANWGKTHIPYDYTSCALDMGSIYNRKWLTKIHLVGENAGNVAMQIYAIRDRNQTEQGPIPLAKINYTANLTWGDPSIIWDDPILWKTDGKMDLWRRFPSTALRCNFLQVKFVPASLVVYASSSWPEFCTATITDPGGGQKTATISTPSGYTAIHWPLDIVGYYMSFPDDNYEAQYLISAVDEDEATLEDATDALTTLSDVEWQISGVKKEQRPHITSFVLHYGYLGTKNEKYPGPHTNDGSGNAGGNPT